MFPFRSKMFLFTLNFNICLFCLFIFHISKFGKFWDVTFGLPSEFKKEKGFGFTKRLDEIWRKKVYKNTPSYEVLPEQLTRATTLLCNGTWLG